MSAGVPLACGLIATLVAPWSIAADDDLYTFAQADRFEYADNEGAFVWDLQGWIGGDYRKVWVKSEGSRENGSSEDSEVQILYSQARSAFFDWQLGLRLDQAPSPNRSYLVLGLQGLAPQWFEIDTAFFLSDRGELSARFEAEYDLLLTQRLILQPRFELELSGSDVPDRGIGRGLAKTELGVRLRYELRRKIAPYIGINWTRLGGNTADFARANGQSVEHTSFIAGLRLWY
ncbi:MAG: copper resistance protein B [Pseudomonadota bacterium]